MTSLILNCLLEVLSSDSLVGVAALVQWVLCLFGWESLNKPYGAEAQESHHGQLQWAEQPLRNGVYFREKGILTPEHFSSSIACVCVFV